MHLPAIATATFVAMMTVSGALGADDTQPTRIVTCSQSTSLPPCRTRAIDAAGRFLVYSVPFFMRGEQIFVHDIAANTDRLLATFDFIPFMEPRITDDGRYIFFANIAANARAYDTSTGTLLNFDAVVIGGIYHIAVDWSRDLRYVLYGVFLGDVRNQQVEKLFVYDQQSGAVQPVPLEGGTPVGAARLSPDGRYVTYTTSSAIWLVDRMTGSGTRLLESPFASVTLGAQLRQFTSDGQYLMASGTTFETATGRAVVRLPDGSVSPNGRYVAFPCSNDGHETTVCVYDQVTTWRSRLPPGRLSPRFFDDGRVPPSAVVDDLGRVAVNALEIAPPDVYFTCGSFFVPPPRTTAASAGETATVRLTVSSGAACSWTAQSNVPWIAITSPPTGVGSADLTYVVSSNPGGVTRTGTLTIAGQTFAVTQSQNPDARPGAPVALRATNRLIGSLIWSPPVDGGDIVNYVVEGGSAPGLADRFRASTGRTTSMPLAPPRGQPLYVRVRASNSFGDSIASNETVVLIDPAAGCPFPPDAPTELSASIDGAAVSLRWSMARVIDTSFVIEGGSASGLANLANYLTGTSALSLVAPGVPAGAYFVRVRGINVCGVGPPSNEVVVNVR